ncbi:nitric oxide reductase activation protein NorD [Nocardia sp. N2S4-5]|uniref:nitric oxide reductase activation protein NorD n=1 Tax=Nocardia sp. N2S4-5 TaxID=3351565 RepID=UPI0037CE14BA
MISADATGLGRFRLLAAHVAGRSVEVAYAPAGTAPHTTGRTIFVTAGRPAAEQRRELLVQAALLGAGSLDPPLVKALRRRPSLARRYLAVEGRRVLTALAAPLRAAADLPVEGEASTTTAEHSLAVARRRGPVADPPPWFGVIEPARLLAAADTRTTENAPHSSLVPLDIPEADDQSGGSNAGKFFGNPFLSSRTLLDLFRNGFGAAGQGGDGPAADMKIRAVRRTATAGIHARPLSTRIRFDDDGKPDAILTSGGALYPEWDVHQQRYRPEWCRVIDFPLTDEVDIAAAAVAPDDVLRRRLARVGLGLETLRGRPDGDELDLEALVDLFVDLRSGYSPPEHVYREHRRLARDLGVLILLDASGSATETDTDGLTVHDHQRRAAATLAATLEELGDRVAVYGFRSHGRRAVHLPSIKTFGQRFGAVERARINQLQPTGYTRLGAGIRGAGRILETRAGTRNRLLLLLSDGLPYEDGYAGHYAEADTRKALEELRGEGIGCLCLSLGTDTESLDRVFGPGAYAGAGTLAELSPRMDELFLACLREFSAPTP